MKIDSINFAVFLKIEVSTKVLKLYSTSESVNVVFPAVYELSGSRYIVTDTISRRFRSWNTGGLKACDRLMNRVLIVMDQPLQSSVNLKFSCRENWFYVGLLRQSCFMRWGEKARVVENIRLHLGVSLQVPIHGYETLGMRQLFSGSSICRSHR